MGFEPTVPFRTFAFKANAIDRSAIPPKWSPKSDLNRRPPTYKEGALPLSYSGVGVAASCHVPMRALLSAHVASYKSRVASFRDHRRDHPALLGLLALALFLGLPRRNRLLVGQDRAVLLDVPAQVAAAP